MTRTIIASKVATWAEARAALETAKSSGVAVELESPAALQAASAAAEQAIAAAAGGAGQATVVVWGADAEKELRKIPFFVRGKARRNTELYARDKGLPVITLETLYDAKAHFSR